VRGREREEEAGRERREGDVDSYAQLEQGHRLAKAGPESRVEKLVGYISANNLTKDKRVGHISLYECIKFPHSNSQKL